MGQIGKARVPTDSELKRLFSITKVGQHARRNAAMLSMSYRLGFRAKEIASLRVSDVLDEQGKLREECGLTGKMTKGGKPRVAYLTNPAVRQSLKEYLDERRAQEGILFNVASALFKSQKGNGFSPNTLQQLLRRLHDRAGIVGGRSHSGRRWFATELISRGTDIKAVSVLMGHSSVAMTARYAEDNPQRLRRIVANLV
jgi:integrase/recombinase XerD